MSRRMFSPLIVDSDAFLDMPSSAQNLYFHLGMRADDDGFVSNPKKIMKIVNSGEDDLKILFAKRFIIGFDSGIIVIKHWRINNLIRKDWYRETQYLEEKSSLIIKENGSYTEKSKEFVNENVTKPQRRLGKVSIGKDKEPIAEASSAEWNLETYKKQLEDSTRRELNIIALYWDYKKPVLNSVEQARNEIKRNLRAANSLKPYEDARLIKTIEYLQKQANFKWTLETILKYITERELKNA